MAAGLPTTHRPPLRVAMVTGEYPPAPGGIADYTALLVRYLAALGVQVNVIDGFQVRGSRFEKPDRTSNLEPRTRWNVSCWPRIARLAEGCQVVHVQYQAAAYGLGGAITLLPLWLRLVRPRVRVVTTFHDLRVPYLFPKAGPLRRVAVRAMLEGSHAAILSNMEDLEAAGPGPGRHRIPIGSSIPRHPLGEGERAVLRQGLEVEPHETLVGYFGFANASKGLDTLVEALAHLRADGLAARLLLVGEQAGASDPTDLATAARVDALVAERDLASAVLRTGRLSAEQVSAHLQACEVVALPFRDGASLRRSSLIAALAQAVPIVTTAVPPTAPGSPRRRRGDTELSQENDAYALLDGEHALLVPADHPRSLAQAISRVAREDDLRRHLAGGAAALGSRFSWPTIATATLGVYEGLVSKEARAAC